jgi:hypothetical protein
MRHALRSLLLAPALLATATAARADFLYNFTFSGTISRVDDMAVFNGNPIRLLPDVNVGDPFQGSGAFTVPTVPASGSVMLTGGFITASGPGSLGFSTHLNPGAPSFFVPSMNFLHYSGGSSGQTGLIPVHIAVLPTLTQYDYLQDYILDLSPSGSSMSLLIQHNSLRVTNQLFVDVTVTTYSIVPEPGSLPLLAVGACGTLAAGFGLRRRGRREGGR